MSTSHTVPGFLVIRFKKQNFSGTSETCSPLLRRTIFLTYGKRHMTIFGAYEHVKPHAGLLDPSVSLYLSPILALLTYPQPFSLQLMILPPPSRSFLPSYTLPFLLAVRTASLNMSLFSLPSCSPVSHT